MLHSIYTTIAGRTIHTRVVLDVEPHALPIVLVHGLSVSSRYMVPLAEALAPHRRVYAPDLPGFGLSEKPRDILDVPQLAVALCDWMDYFALDRAVLVGNSMGCQIIAALANSSPERVVRAVFNGPTVDRAGRNLVEQARRLALDGLREPLTSVLTQLSDYGRAGPRRTIRTMQHALRDPLEARVPHMFMPVLVTRGQRDVIAPRRWCEELTALLPNGRLLEFPGSPHATNYADPQPLAQAIIDFTA